MGITITRAHVRAIMFDRMRTGYREKVRASRLGPNRDPARITAASWWFQGENLALSPGTLDGGVYADKSGFHNSRRANQLRWAGNYSYRHPDDMLGPDDKAAAYDKTYPDAQAGRYASIIRDCAILEKAADRGDPRLVGWVEYYGQADADTVVEGRNFRTGAHITAGSSHLWHEHDSECRAFVNSWMNKRAMLSVKRQQPLDEWIREEGLDVVPLDIWQVLLSGPNNDMPHAAASGDLLFEARMGIRALRAELAIERAERRAGDAADAVRDDALMVAVKALSAGGSVEAAPILAAIERVHGEALERFTELETELAAERSRREFADLRSERLAQALARAGADLQTADDPPTE
jgi:hypothetical protein